MLLHGGVDDPPSLTALSFCVPSFNSRYNVLSCLPLLGTLSHNVRSALPADESLQYNCQKEVSFEVFNNFAVFKSKCIAGLNPDSFFYCFTFWILSLFVNLIVE